MNLQLEQNKQKIDLKKKKVSKFSNAKRKKKCYMALKETVSCCCHQVENSVSANVTFEQNIVKNQQVII